MMTFDELLEKLSYDYLHPAKRPDGSLDADKNGHTRLADLQEKYHLSSLKVQKLLVTAGVYKPVKTGSSYYAVKQLRDAGKSVEEIMAELNLSKAAVNAFLPYEKNIHNAEAFGVEVSDEAERKRRQRSNEEMKKENARDILADTMSDEALWTAIGEHDNETFISTSGQRFHLSALRGVQGKRNGLDISYQLTVAILNKANKVQDIKMIPKEVVLDSFHSAIEFKAEEKAQTVDDEGKHAENRDSADCVVESRKTALLSRLGAYVVTHCVPYQVYHILPGSARGQSAVAVGKSSVHAWQSERYIHQLLRLRAPCNEETTPPTWCQGHFLSASWLSFFWKSVTFTH